jgi:hypothetical protein
MKKTALNKNTVMEILNI